MMSREQEFLEKYEKEKQTLEEWGKFIINYIIDELKYENYNIDKFLKVPAMPRLKDNNSIIEKAFYRGKNYENPIEDITDKVGTRFVVLLVSEIKIIEDIIEKCNCWEYSKDKDFEKERDENPTFFNYQSVHYIIMNNKSLTVNNTLIKENTKCEVQIRTLLQHAYSELTHDTVYKPKQNVKPTPIVQRLVARSMAMIETTDYIFKEVNDTMVKENNIKSNNLLPMMREEYTKIKDPEENIKIQDLIIESYADIIQKIDKDNFMEFIKHNQPIIVDQVTKKYKSELLFRQPIILLIYYLIEKYPSKLKANWPLTEDLIKPIYAKLGTSFNND